MESEKKQKLVIDGNSFYEIEKKQKQEEAEKRQQKRQRK